MLMWMASREFYQVCYFFLMVFVVISIPFVRDLFHRPSVRDMLGRWRLPMTLECTTALSALVAMVSSSGHKQSLDACFARGEKNFQCLVDDLGHATNFIR